MQSKQLRQYQVFSLIYSFVVVFVNFISVFASELMMFPVTGLSQFIFWKQFMDDNHLFTVLAEVIAFSVPAILCVIYTLPPLLLKKEEAIKSRITNIPIVYSLFGITGWTSNFLCEIIFLVVFHSGTNQPINGILFTSLVYTILESLFSFICSYFIMETISRAKVLPLFYPNGYVSREKGTIKPSINALFIIYYISICVFPVFVVTGSYLEVQILNNIPVNKSVLIITVMLSLSALFLTIVFSRIFSTPLHKLKDGAAHIQSGDYSHRIPIFSNDEMGVLSDSFNDMTKSLEEKEKMRDLFGKVVDPEVRDYLLTQNKNLGGRISETAILFCDIRGFTTLSEKMSPEKIVSFLNTYFSAMEKCITSNHGIINKYIGDAIMAIFGAPVHSETYCYNAWQACLEMRKTLVELNKDFINQGIPEIRFGIGLHSGPVLAGNIGASSRMEYTVIGDTVNTASRIENLCKEYKCDLLISETCINEIQKEVSNLSDKSFTYLSEVDIRGRNEKIKLYQSL